MPYYEYALDTILDSESTTAARFSKEQQESIESAAELLYGLIHARYIITPRGMAAMMEKYKSCHFGRCPRVHCQGQPGLPVGQVCAPCHVGPYPCPCPLRCAGAAIARTTVARTTAGENDQERAGQTRPLPAKVRSPHAVHPWCVVVARAQSDLPRMHTTKIFCARCEDIYYPRSSRQANVDGAYFGTTFCHLFLQTYSDLVPSVPTASYVPRIFGFKIHKPKKGGGGAGNEDTSAAAASSSAVGDAPAASAGALEMIPPKQLPPPVPPTQAAHSAQQQPGGSSELKPATPKR